ncbi:uncharacterized protein LOC143627151 [Bidens hawaiensis]|uniref:uncharacterized protein LOC143627151 n=1 Tax=Bidens hawaiensis TaxID=980011 RepID=UPI004049EF6E
MLVYGGVLYTICILLAGVQSSDVIELGVSPENFTGGGTAVPETMVPEKVGMMMGLVLNDTRRKLGSFKICSLCTCCSGKGYCVPSPCCYAINCNIPNRPFGFCSFTPKTCNCFGCHL